MTNFITSFQIIKQTVATKNLTRQKILFNTKTKKSFSGAANTNKLEKYRN